MKKREFGKDIREIKRSGRKKNRGEKRVESEVKYT